jgi:cobalt-zinc-cadmium efflux system membrane fusion protein
MGPRSRRIRAGLLLALLSMACDGGGELSEEKAEATHGEHEEEEARGPNGGRLLTSGDFALELGIFEGGVPPEYRAWATRQGEPLDPGEVELEVRLTRLGGQIDVIGFTPRGDHLVSTSPIAEPHSFEVSIEVTHRGERHAWAFEHFEGRTRIDPAMAESLGVETEVAGPATLETSVTVYGQVRTNPERVREIRARFEGVAREVHARVGDEVRKGEKLVTVESNESLSLYTIVAPISGTLTQRNVNPGEQTGDRILMTITDTSSVWVDLSVFPVDRRGVVVGRPVSIRPALGGDAVEGVVGLLEAVADPHDQTVIARVELVNADDEFRPGTFVRAEVQVAEVDVPLAVKRIGLQEFRDFDVVYAQVGDVYEVRMLELGLEAGEWVEVLAGLEPRTRYVTSNSHLIKADIEKSGASHGH